MSEGGTERLLERAERSVAMERDAAVARIRSGLTAEGSAECGDCGEPIEPRRRVALPSARTCVKCQTARESQRRRQ